MPLSGNGAPLARRYGGLLALALISVLVALTALVGPGRSGQAQTPPPPTTQQTRPNVLIFITDDQRADTLGVMPKTRQWFESGGVKFVNAYASTPVCCPSRASIMTGQYAHNHNVQTNGSTERLDQRSTLQRYLQDAGYVTGIAGKYFNQWAGDPPHFDEWTIFLERHAGYYGATYNTGGSIQKVPTYSTDYLASEAMRFLKGFETRDDRPWLLYVTPYAPHAPQKPARRHLGVPVRPWAQTPSVLERDRTDKPAWVLGKRLYGKEFTRLRKTREGQIRTLLAVDDLVDQVMTTVGNLDEDNRTMAFFVSDNGFLWGEHGLKQKQAPYTASVRIPFLLRWPGHVGAGQVVTWPVATIDIVPTVFETVGITPDPQYPVDGLHLLGSSRERVLLEFYRRSGRRVPTWASTRTESYQYTEWYGDDLQTIEFREYYDLHADPWQLTNLLADPDPYNDPSPEFLEQLSQELAAARRCSGTAPEGSGTPSPSPSPSPASDGTTPTCP